MKRFLAALAVIAAAGAVSPAAASAAEPQKPAAAKPAPATSAPATSSPAASAPSTPAPAASAKPAAGTPAPAVVDSLGLLERAVARDSSKFDNLYRLGSMLLDRDRVTEAIRVFHKAKQLRPKDHKVVVNLGAAYDAAGQPATAQTYYRDALKMAPADSVAMCRLASSLYAQGQYKESMQMLRSMIGSGASGPYCAYFTLGVAFADAGIYRDAIRMWRKVVEIAPQSPEASSAKESIEVLEKFVGN